MQVQYRGRGGGRQPRGAHAPESVTGLSQTFIACHVDWTLKFRDSVDVSGADGLAHWPDAQGESRRVKD